MVFPLVVSFYTKDTMYQLEVQNLIGSCEFFAIDHHVEPIESFGSWEANCGYKPFFIHRMLQKFQRPVLWMDADAVFNRKPEVLAEFSKDFAVRINEDLSMENPSKVISGTVYANYTEGADRLLRLWARFCKEEINRMDREVEFWDQVALREVLYKGEHGASFVSLPLSYTAIFDHLGDKEKESSPVIEHYQASRRYKKMI